MLERDVRAAGTPVAGTPVAGTPVAGTGTAAVLDDVVAGGCMERGGCGWLVVGTGRLALVVIAVVGKIAGVVCPWPPGQTPTPTSPVLSRPALPAPVPSGW